jgi:hypothetical protein
MMQSFAKWRKDIAIGTVTGGTSTAYTLTTNATFASVSDMDAAILAFAVHTTSGAAPTIAVDGLAAKNLVSATGVTLPAGALVAGAVVLASYLNSANEFRVIGAPIPPDDSVSTAKIANDAVTYAKMQEVAAVSLIGNATGGTANPTGITLATGLAFSGSTLTVGGTPTYQKLTSGSGATYTTASLVKWLRVRCVGGGGGGAGTGAGGSGGTSTFNSIDAAGGAGGGISSASAIGTGGAGGTGGSGTATLRTTGSSGDGGSYITQTGGAVIAGLLAGGSGGDSPFGGRGTSATAAVANSGSGGGGKTGGVISGSPSTSQTGAGGGAGEYFELVIGSPAATYTYTIGAAGAAGSGGGTAGGSGYIVVEEYYA